MIMNSQKRKLPRQVVQEKIPLTLYVYFNHPPNQSQNQDDVKQYIFLNQCRKDPVIQ